MVDFAESLTINISGCVIQGYLKYSKLAEQRSESADTKKKNKKLFRAYNRAFTKNDEAGLKRNRFYFCRYAVAINEKVI